MADDLAHMTGIAQRARQRTANQADTDDGEFVDHDGTKKSE
jgi:hypothetical protein